MKAINIGRLAAAAGAVLFAGVFSALAVAQDSSPVSRTNADALDDAIGLGSADAVTSDELDRMNSTDPVTGTLPIPTSEARGADLSLKPLNTAPRSVLIRILPTTLTTGN